MYNAESECIFFIFFVVRAGKRMNCKSNRSIVDCITAWLMCGMRDCVPGCSSRAWSWPWREAPAAACSPTPSLRHAPTASPTWHPGPVSLVHAALAHHCTAPHCTTTQNTPPNRQNPQSPIVCNTTCEITFESYFTIEGNVTTASLFIFKEYPFY